MKQKLLTIIVFLIIVLLLIKVFTNKKEETKIPTFKSDLVCTKDINELDEDGEEVKSKSIIYVDLNDEYVSRLTYVSIVESDFPSSYKTLVDSIMDIYKNVDGIDAYSVIEGNNIASIISYEMRNLNLKQIKNELSEFMDDKSIFMNIKELPFKYEYYKNNYLDGYECK